MSGGGVRLRLVRRRGDKVVRQWVAEIEPDDRDALAAEYLTGVRAQVGALSDKEARTFAPDYRLELFHRVGGWTRVAGKA